MTRCVINFHATFNQGTPAQRSIDMNAGGLFGGSKQRDAPGILAGNVVRCGPMTGFLYAPNGSWEEEFVDAHSYAPAYVIGTQAHTEYDRSLPALGFRPDVRGPPSWLRCREIRPVKLKPVAQPFNFLL